MKKFLNYMHNFRGIAIVFIVAGHCISAFDWEKNFLLSIVLRIFIQNGTVLFVFIAGFLFQHLSYKYDFKTYMRSKWNNVLLPYIILSVPAIVKAVFIVNNKGFYEYPKIFQIFLFYITGRHLGPLWFIPMIALYYIISPILIKSDRSNVIYYLLPLWLIISSIIPRNDLSVPQCFVHFFSVYVGGMFCSKYKEQVLNFIEKYFVSILILFTAILALDVYMAYVGSRLMVLNLWSKLILCLILMGALYRYDGVVKERFKYLAEISFGIYFIHSYVISVFSKIIPDHSISGNLIFYSLYASSAIAFTSLLLAIAKKVLGGRSRSIVGC